MTLPNFLLLEGKGNGHTIQRSKYNCLQPVLRRVRVNPRIAGTEEPINFKIQRSFPPRTTFYKSRHSGDKERATLRTKSTAALAITQFPFWSRILVTLRTSLPPSSIQPQHSIKHKSKCQHQSKQSPLVVTKHPTYNYWT